MIQTRGSVGLSWDNCSSSTIEYSFVFSAIPATARAAAPPSNTTQQPPAYQCLAEWTAAAYLRGGSHEISMNSPLSSIPAIEQLAIVALSCN